MSRKGAGLSESQIAEKFLYDDEEEVLQSSSSGKHRHVLFVLFAHLSPKQYSLVA
jgi:hypothetical protein